MSGQHTLRHTPFRLDWPTIGRAVGEVAEALTLALRMAAFAVLAAFVVWMLASQLALQGDTSGAVYTIALGFGAICYVLVGWAQRYMRRGGRR